MALPGTIGPSRADVERTVEKMLLERFGVLHHHRIAGQVSDEKIQDGAVTTAKIADDAITPAKVTPTGAYSFLKVLDGAEGDWRVDFGSDSMTGDGTPVQTKSIAHQLGVTPSAVVVTHSGGTLMNAGVTAVSSTAFTVGLRHINASNWSSTESFYYILIGFTF